MNSIKTAEEKMVYFLIAVNVEEVKKGPGTRNIKERTQRARFFFIFLIILFLNLMVTSTSIGMFFIITLKIQS